MPLAEAAEIHAIIDTDGDGEISFAEFEAAKSLQKQVKLPKPVKPIRSPMSSAAQRQRQQQQQPQQQQQQQQQQPQQRWQQPQQQQPQQQWQQPQQQWQQPQQPQQQQPQQQWQQPPMNQPAAIRPTIQSGFFCRGCRIGVDPGWRHCPVCGMRTG